MPFRTTIRILLSLTIVLVAMVGGAHGSTHADRQVVATVQASSTARVVDGGCTSSGQAHCHPFWIAEDRAVWTYGGELRAAALPATNDPHRSGSDPRLEEKPPRSFR